MSKYQKNIFLTPVQSYVEVGTPVLIFVKGNYERFLTLMAILRLCSWSLRTHKTSLPGLRHYIEEIPIHYIGEISLQYIGEMSVQSSLGRNERVSRDMLLVADLQGVATKNNWVKLKKIQNQIHYNFDWK